MAPEQLFGGGTVDARADLYSLGCVAFEMLAGRAPFENPVARASVGDQAAPLVTATRPDIPPAVAAVVGRVLAIRPEDRYETAARFAEALSGAAAGASAEAPGPPSSAARHNLPHDRTPFIGRERDIAECGRALETSRLVTLTGIGGAGKTRLAIRVATTILPQHRDGAGFVDLAPLSEPERVAEAVAAAVGVAEQPGKNLVDAVIAHLREKRFLLVLDNCEHLLAASADLAARLLRDCGSLHVIATSREGLGIEGERIVALRSLSVPGTVGSVTPEVAGASEAVRLFVDRARAVETGFTLTPENAATVAEICRRLDGIPLAIELAAARTRVLTVSQIRERLDDRFRLLTGAGRASISRHQALRATIQWSFDHLDPEERRLANRLAVFSGGWTLDGATRVAGDGADEFEVMDLLLRLADKSLIQIDRDPNLESRYRMLETVRQFALETLVASGDSDAARAFHREEFLRLAERAHGERNARGDAWTSVLEAEHGNLRAALESWRAADPERYLELAALLAWFWHVRSHFLEGSEHLLAALAATPSDPARPARARALRGLGTLLSWQGDADSARARLTEALVMWRRIGDREEIARALEGIGWTYLLGGDAPRALETFEECFRLQSEIGDPVLLNRAKVALAQTLVAVGDTLRARPMAEEIVAFSRPRGERRNEHFGVHFLADCELIDGRCAKSLDRYRESLELAHAIGDRLETTFEIQGVAMSLAGLGKDEAAITLEGAVLAERKRMGTTVSMRFWDELLRRYLGGAADRLGSEQAGRARGAGRLIPFDEAVRRALGA
jgi:non-specific serine/threonine protein kinase